jgi:hypothetical protein
VIIIIEEDGGIKEDGGRGRGGGGVATKPKFSTYKLATKEFGVSFHVENFKRLRCNKLLGN